MLMEYLARGKRGIVYLEESKGKKVVVKMQRQDITVHTLENEARWLKILNKQGIGPKIIGFSNGKLAMEYVEGEPLQEWYKEASKVERKRVIKSILSQCRTMDILQVNKLEMHNPVKHIIVRKTKPVMIDFERCKKTPNPKNVTQFCQFLLKLGMPIDQELENLLRIYKKSQDDITFKRVVKKVLSL